MRLVRLVDLDVRNILDNFHPADNPSKNGVFVIQPRRRAHGDEELAPVRVRAGVGHRDRVGAVVAERGVKLVLKLAAPYALAAHTRAGGVTRLYHEALDDAVEDVAVVVAGLAVDAEVLARLGRLLREEFDVYVSHRRVKDGILVNLERSYKGISKTVPTTSNFGM